MTSRSTYSSDSGIIRVTRYNRFWAVWKESELIAVTVYRKGAESVARLARKAEGLP